MDPVSVVALVGFGLQATDIVKRLLDFLDQVKDAPSSVERLKTELQILEGIIYGAIEDDKQKLEDASERTWKAYQKALEAVSQQCQALLNLLEKTLAKKGMSRRKRLLNSVNYVFRGEEFTKLVEGLERAKSSFQLAQLCITNSESNELVQESQETTLATVKSPSADSVPSENSCEASSGTASNTAAFQPADRLKPQSSLTELHLGGFAYVKQQERFNILKDKTAATMFHNPLLGTVVVTRRTTVTRNWNAETQQYEKEQEGVQTNIRIRPTPWLFSAAYEIQAEEIITRYGSSHLNVALKPLRYAPISNMLDIRDGNLTKLQSLLSARKFSINDRDQWNERNLLGLSLEALQSDWFFAECNPEKDIEKATRRGEIVRTCRWLVSQGVTYDFQPDDPFITGVLHLGAPKNSYDALKQVQEYESLLLESTDSSPCLQRAKMLLLYGLQNPEHSQQLRSTVVDLMQEAAVDHGPDVLASDERAFWADEDPFNPEIASVIMKSMLCVARAPQHALRLERRKALKGTRRMLHRVFDTVGSRSFSEVQMEDFLTCMSVLLGLCRSLAPLDDGFGTHLTNVFRGNGRILDVWRASLRRAGYEPERFMGGVDVQWEGSSDDLPPPPHRLHGSSGSCADVAPIPSTSAEGFGPHSSCAYPSWNDLDAVTEHFIGLELAPEPAADSPPVDEQSKSLVARIATVGLELVTSIV